MPQLRSKPSKAEHNIDLVAVKLDVGDVGDVGIPRCRPGWLRRGVTYNATTLDPAICSEHWITFR